MAACKLEESDVVSAQPAAGPTAAPGPELRPQSLMLALLAERVLDRGILVVSGSFIEVFARVGISEQATRSTLNRMVHRDLLYRRRCGRRMYFGLTERCEQLLRDGGRRVWKLGVVNAEPGTEWTLIAFSFPDAWKRQRHELRSRLTWAGFGMLYGGLWLAPAQVEVGPVLDELGLGGHVTVFAARPLPPTDVARLVRDAYDLGAIAERYHAFLDRWDAAGSAATAADPLVRQLLLASEWLNVIRTDPRLPLDLLPEDWPAARAQRAFRALHTALERPAQHSAEAVLETIPASRPTT